ncbi:hypothetical protein EB796_018197 [Bugula neritina]|uniref:Uncharacterized protein n=1 Tax=Bugula neritina TaxID=10212 RepID=A0A7J7JB71_BUGNE|nr:hypothetical protein EB796_018197 [Bugula neritina]
MPMAISISCLTIHYHRYVSVSVPSSSTDRYRIVKWNEIEMKGVKRSISSQHSTKLGKKHKISMCECSVISPSNCDVCAKIARKIHRLFGKRLALSNTEIYSKASASQQTLVRRMF